MKIGSQENVQIFVMSSLISVYVFAIRLCICTN